MNISFYKDQFKLLRPDRSAGHARPHKMCMLLAVMDLIEKNEITTNKIYYDKKLKSAFSQRFITFKQKNDKNTPYYPFYFLKSSGFWHHKINSKNQVAYDSIGDAISDSKVKDTIEYAYFDKELFQLLCDPKTRMVFISSLATNFDDMSVFFEKWARDIGKSDKTIKNYLGAIKGSISGWANKANLSNKGLMSIYSYEHFKDVSHEVRELDVFKERNSKGNGMYNAALNLYGDFLADFTQLEITKDITQIIDNAQIKPTDKVRLVNTRLGQGEFRQKLIGYWKGCALTQFNNIPFLVASHIKPWRKANDEERLNVYNGILLLPNLDKAFDLGYISFTEKGKVKISDAVETPEILGIHSNMNIKLEKNHNKFMTYHREQVFKK